MKTLNERLSAMTGRPCDMPEDQAAAELARYGEVVTLFDRTIDRRFTMVPNELVDNRSPYHVPHDAAGCWIHMQQLGPEWQFSVKGFCAISDDGANRVNTQLKALERKGWVLCFRRRERGRWTPGAIWAVLDDPRRAKAHAKRMAALGLELITKPEEIDQDIEHLATPLVSTRFAKRESGADQGIVENFLIVENPDDAESASDCGKLAETRRNPRPQPDSRNPDLENRNLNNIKYKNKIKTISSAAPQRSDTAPSAARGQARAARAWGAEEADQKAEKERERAVKASRPDGLKALRKLYPRPTTGSPERLEKEIAAYRAGVAQAGSHERLMRAVGGYVEEYEESGEDMRYMPSLLNFLDGRGYLESALSKLSAKEAEDADALFAKQLKRVNRELPIYSDAERPVLLAFAEQSGSQELAALAGAARRRGDPDCPEIMRLSVLARNKPHNRAFAAFACKVLDERSRR